MKAEVIVKAPGSGTLGYPLEAELEWLFAHGVAPKAMTEPWPLRSARVVFDGLYGFDFSRHGERAIIFKAEDRGDELDLIAWEASTGKLASWHGNTFCLCARQSSGPIGALNHGLVRSMGRCSLTRLKGGSSAMSL